MKKRARRSVEQSAESVAARERQNIKKSQIVYWIVWCRNGKWVMRRSKTDVRTVLTNTNTLMRKLINSTNFNYIHILVDTYV